MEMKSTATSNLCRQLEAALASLPPLDGKRHVVVFDCDGTVIAGDIGEAMLYYQLEHHLFKIPPPEIWTDHPDPRALHDLYQHVSQGGGQEETSKFSDMILDRYFGLLAKGETAKACSDITRLLAGFSVTEARHIAEQTLRKELSVPQGSRRMGSHTVAQGVRYIKETVDALNCFSERYEVLVISGSNIWSVQAVFGALGFPEEQVMGIDLHAHNGVLTGLVKGSIPVLEGKNAALRERGVGDPAIVFTDSLYDLPLLKSSTCRKVFVVSGRNSLADIVDVEGHLDESWIIIDQPTILEQENAHTWRMLQ